MQVIGVFKGGGAKGALYSGALRAIADRGISFSQVAGSSAGAITAAFVAAGATAEDLRRLERSGRRLLEMPSGVAGAHKLRNHYGVLSLDDLRQWIAEHLIELLERDTRGHVLASDNGPGGPTFAELDNAGAIPLHMAAADLRWRSPVVFNAQLTPNLPVADAAAASSAIPFLFEAPFVVRAEGLHSPPFLSDGGVMSNLPLFIFTDSSYRAVAGLDSEAAPDPILAFSFVDDETPQHTSPRGAVGDAYRQRFAGAIGVSTITQAIDEASQSADGGSGRSPRGRRPKEETVKVGAGPIRRAAMLVLDVVLRALERILLPLVSWLTFLGRHSTAGSFAVRARNPRTRRWLRFADGVFDLAPGYIVIGTILLVLVLTFGIPEVAAFLWPNWSDLVANRSLGESLFGVFFAGIGLLIAGIGLLALITMIVLGLAAYVAGWVTKPVAAQIGSDLIATFMHNPQEPPWTGAAGEGVVVIRLSVPNGWTLLRSTDDEWVMEQELERIRASVAEQLERAGLGTSPAPQPPERG